MDCGGKRVRLKKKAGPRRGAPPGMRRLLGRQLQTERVAAAAAVVDQTPLVLDQKADVDQRKPVVDPKPSTTPDTESVKLAEPKDVDPGVAALTAKLAVLALASANKPDKSDKSDKADVKVEKVAAAAADESKGVGYVRRQGEQRQSVAMRSPDDPNLWRFPCPSCSGLIEVTDKDLNCRIFRHGETLNPHANAQACADFARVSRQRLGFEAGCGAAMRFGDGGVVTLCGYDT